MARHHDKLIASASAAARAPDGPRARTEPMSRAEVESFVKGFGLSARAVRRLVEEWTADTQRAQRSGYDAGYADGQDASY